MKLNNFLMKFSNQQTRKLFVQDMILIGKRCSQFHFFCIFTFISFRYPLTLYNILWGGKRLPKSILNKRKYEPIDGFQSSARLCLVSMKTSFLNCHLFSA